MVSSGARGHDEEADDVPLLIGDGEARETFQPVPRLLRVLAASALVLLAAAGVAISFGTRASPRWAPAAARAEFAAFLEAVAGDAARPAANASKKVASQPAEGESSRERGVASQATAAAVYRSGAICGRQTYYLGIFSSANRCAKLVAAREGCGQHFMFSSLVPDWGCRCCGINESSGGDVNPAWDVYAAVTLRGARWEACWTSSAREMLFVKASECYATLEEAKEKCFEAGDCYAVATHSKDCNGQFRVSHGNATFIEDGPRHSNNTRSYQLDPACHEVPIDGGWSSWSTCSAASNGTDGEACGGMQARHCNSPAPKYGGAECEGSLEGSLDITRACNTTACVDNATKLCPDDEELFGGKCYMKCSNLTKHSMAIRTSPWTCCNAEPCTFINQDFDIGFCSGFDIDADKNCPHPAGECHPGEERYLGRCYVKCTDLTNGTFPYRLTPTTCCAKRGEECDQNATEYLAVRHKLK